MTAPTTTHTELARRDNSPSGMVQSYAAEFATVLPTHIRPETWVRLAVGVLRRDKKLAEAAGNDPGALMDALMTAARKGLEPGTEQFYLVPRKQKGTLKVQGIEGYQGIIERIYRAGAVSSVVVQEVREGDRFTFVPGRDERPVHEVDWFGGTRGELIGVYAYAVMRGGATSKVVVLNQGDIDQARGKSDGSDSPYSPWTTNPQAMWLKTAARRLEKWVPTSSEYIREQLRAVRDVNAEPPAPGIPAGVDPDTGEIVTAEVVTEDQP